MADDTDQSQKTEEPTQRKLDDARQRGQVASSREVNNWFILLAATVLVMVILPGMMRDIASIVVRFVEQPHLIRVEASSFAVQMEEVLIGISRAVAVAVGLLVVASITSGVSQNGFLLAPESIQPKLEKISLSKGLKRMFSMRSLMEFTKSILKLAIVTSVAIVLLVPEFEGIESKVGLEANFLLDNLYALVLRLLVGVLAVMTVVALIDYLYQRFEFMKQMRMTKQELKDEYKQTEGDPMVKSRLRQIRMERARRRMMAAVPDADVVITNPTHFAVALKYDADEMEAPQLVAKGADNLAHRMRELAEENDVPVVENPPLARALYSGVEIDQEVPPEHYKAVAEIIGYVFGLKGKAMPA
jgi:flagellar biosynthetic protein FlhB